MAYPRVSIPGELSGATPMGRLTTPRDITPVFLFPASEEVTVIAEAYLEVNGGTGFSL